MPHRLPEGRERGGAAAGSVSLWCEGACTGTNCSPDRKESAHDRLSQRAGLIPWLIDVEPQEESPATEAIDAEARATVRKDHQPVKSFLSG